MPVTFRKAAASDIDAVTAIYDAIIAEEEARTRRDRLEARDLSRARHGGGRAHA